MPHVYRMLLCCVPVSILAGVPVCPPDARVECFNHGSTFFTPYVYVCQAACVPEAWNSLVSVEKGECLLAINIYQLQAIFFFSVYVICLSKPMKQGNINYLRYPDTKWRRRAVWRTDCWRNVSSGHLNCEGDVTVDLSPRGKLSKDTKRLKKDW